MDTNSHYYRQVRLLTRILPIIASEPSFALKGGTAINLFVRDLPRLSVDIDLVYLPLDDRDKALQCITAALGRIADAISKAMPDAKLIKSFEERDDVLRIFVTQAGERVKVELSPVLRGSVFPQETREFSPRVAEQFGYVEMPLLSFPDLYAGKLCAALDRQHPRDLFDVKLLFENEGLTPDLVKTFVVYLISHNRTMSELLRPTRKDISGLYEGEFLNMAEKEVSLKELLDVREKLIAGINNALTDDQKRFLISFKTQEPDWSLLGLEDVDKMPAVRWKLQNLERMPIEKHKDALSSLKAILDQGKSGY